MSNVENWNQPAVSRIRLQTYTRLIGNRQTAEIVIPKIGIVLPDLDMQLLNRDLGWGGSNGYNLNMHVVDMTKDSPQATLIKDLFQLEEMDTFQSPEDEEKPPRFIVNCQIRSKEIDFFNLPASLDKLKIISHQPGDFSFWIDKNGCIDSIIATQFPSEIKMTDPESYSGVDAELDSSQSISPDLLDDTHTMESKLAIMSTIGKLSSHATDMGLNF